MKAPTNQANVSKWLRNHMENKDNAQQAYLALETFFEQCEANAAQRAAQQPPAPPLAQGNRGRCGADCGGSAAANGICEDSKAAFDGAGLSGSRQVSGAELWLIKF